LSKPALFRLLAPPLFPLLFAAPAAAADVAGQVVSVHDGDTLTVLVERRQVKVRLADIDAPEMRQPYGGRSKRSLSELCFGKPAVLEVRTRDRYGRTVATVHCAGIDANAEQVRRGYAWIYVRYARANSPLYAIEHEARTARRGLWADSAPVPPWDWRRNGRRPPVARLNTRP